jgi:hypothetical protein
MVVTIAALATCAGAARADASRCIEDHEAANGARRRGTLIESHRLYVACAHDECPAVIREECAARATEVLAAMPSVVFAATDGEGRDLISVVVRVDGAAVAQRLDGKPHRLDPGEHTFTFEAPGRAPITRRLVVREGEKARRVDARLLSVTSAAAPTPGVRPSSQHSGTPVAAYVLGAVAVASLGAFAGFAIAGSAKESELEDECAPGCAPSEVDVMQRHYLIADIALAASVVAAGAATYLFVTAAPAGSSGARAAVSVGGRF